MLRTFHYTDGDGWKGVRSQVDWLFKASKPPHPDRPFGVYFTDLDPLGDHRRELFKRIRVPSKKPPKQDYLFCFVGREGLVQLNGGRGRDRRIFFCEVDYKVAPPRKVYEGRTDDYQE